MASGLEGGEAECRVGIPPGVVDKDPDNHDDDSEERRMDLKFDSSCVIGWKRQYLIGHLETPTISWSLSIDRVRDLSSTELGVKSSWLNAELHK